MPKKSATKIESPDGMDAILAQHGIKTDAANIVLVAEPLKPIFPMQYLQVVDGSELPPNKFIIWLTGEHESGKSTAAAGADPVRPGKPSRTFYLDIEGSTATLRTQYSLSLYETLAVEADAKYNHIDGRPERLFMAYLDLVKRIKEGKEPLAQGKRTLVIDPLDKLFEGSNAWVRRNPQAFGKHPGAFNGKDGTIFSYGPTHDWWNDHFIEMTAYFDLIVVISHIGDKWEDNKKVGLKIKGPNLGRCSSLTIWMHAPKASENEPGIPQNTRWAELKKNRYGWVYWPTLDDLKADGTLDRLVQDGVLEADEVENGELDEEDDRLWEYMQEQPHQILPRKFPVPAGKTVFNIIKGYMRNPQKSYGELDMVLNPGDENALSDDDKLQLKTEQALAEAETERLKNERLFIQAKSQLFARLKEIGYTADEIKAAMAEKGLTLQTLSDIEVVFEALQALKVTASV